MIYNMRGDAYHAGPVMLSDVYTSAVGSAKDGVAASQRALYNAYSSLNSRTSSLETKTMAISRTDVGSNHNGMIINFVYNGNTYSFQIHVDRSAGISLYRVGDPYVAIWTLDSFIKVLDFNVIPQTKTSGIKSNTITIPSGYKLLSTHPFGDYISGDADIRVTDKNVSLSGTTATIKYFLYNSQNKSSNINYAGSILLIRTVV